MAIEPEPETENAETAPKLVGVGEGVTEGSGSGSPSLGHWVLEVKAQRRATAKVGFKSLWNSIS